MEPLKTKGIVIRSAQTGDYNLMLTVLCRDIGRISVWAKGAKSPKHPAASSVSPLCYSEFVLNKRKEVYSLSAATLEEGFYGIRNSLDKLSYSLYFASLAEKVCSEGTDADEIIRLLLNALHYTENDKKKLPDLRLMYELKILTYSGFAPEAGSCSLCEGAPAFFEPSLGGAVCENCKRADSKRVSKNALALMSFYVSAPLTAAFAHKGQPDLVEEALMLIEDFIKFHIGHVSALDYLKSVTG
jgi:DNA repair protein RecO (recombination protein O)